MVKLNGRPYVHALLLQGMEKEFALGHLYAQGIISGMRDVESMTEFEGGVDVVLRESVLSCTPRILRRVDSSLEVGRGEIYRCVKQILDSEIFARTEAVHSAGLFLEGKEPVAITEDLGRHHALDKVIGAGLVAGIDFLRCVAASTGRQPKEMIHKCINAGIPIIATKGVPTNLAVEAATGYGITIVGMVGPETMVLYSHPERVK